MYDNFGKRSHAVHDTIAREVDSAGFHECRGVTRSVDAMRRLQQDEDPDKAVERLVARVLT